MTGDSNHPFTAEQFNALSQEERQTVLVVAEYLTGNTGSSIEISDEELSSALNLMKTTEGCIPQEIDGDVIAPIRRKCAAVYGTAMEMAEAELERKGLKDRKDFNFCLVIEASYEDTTHVGVVDYDKPICYLHEWNKAWHFQFGNLADLAGAVLAAKATLVNKVTEFTAKEIIIVQEEGRVRQVVGLPPNIQVTVVDYDIEDEEEQYLSPSPVDGQLCKLTQF